MRRSATRDSRVVAPATQPYDDEEPDHGQSNTQPEVGLREHIERAELLVAAGNLLDQRRRSITVLRGDVQIELAEESEQAVCNEAGDHARVESYLFEDNQQHGGQDSPKKRAALGVDGR